MIFSLSSPLSLPRRKKPDFIPGRNNLGHSSDFCLSSPFLEPGYFLLFCWLKKKNFFLSFSFLTEQLSENPPSVLVIRPQDRS